MTKRPSGRRTMRIGFSLLGLALIGFLVSLFLSDLLPLDQQPAEHWRMVADQIASALWPLCFMAGIACVAFGYLVFAISFLPSSEDNASNH
jgi:hypothetical protein